MIDDKDFIQYGANTIPSYNIIKYIKETYNTNPIIELHSGNGLWAAILKKMGCVIYATDDDENSDQAGNNSVSPKNYTNVEKLSYSEALSKYNKCKILFLCNPGKYNIKRKSINSTNSEEEQNYINNYLALKQFTEANNGETLIYIGKIKDIEEIHRTMGLYFLAYLTHNWDEEVLNEETKTLLKIPIKKTKHVETKPMYVKMGKTLPIQNLPKVLVKEVIEEIYIYTRKLVIEKKTDIDYIKDYTILYKGLINFGLKYNTVRNITYLLDYLKYKLSIINKPTSNHIAVNDYRNNISWVTPNINILTYIKKKVDILDDKRILEIGAGYGLWAAFLKMMGCNIIATDDYSWMKKEVEKNLELYTDVENLPYIEALRKYNNCKRK